MKKSGQKNEEIDIRQYIALEEELEAAREEYGVKKKEGRISHMISGFFDSQEGHEEQLLDRRKYLLLALFTGWFGGHRFYAKQYKTGVLYLLFFWTGFPIAMTLIDLMVALPKKTDSNGKILV